MQTRTRFIYSKRNGACFVPHIALAQMFSRSASRAGLKLIMTQGFSPRAKLSFAPELPAGVVALNEPVDMYFESVPDNVVDLMNNSLPEGFKISRRILIPDDSPSLGKACKYAEYLIKNVVENVVEKFFGISILKIENVDGWTRIILKDPAQNPIGGLVKFLINENVITGWKDINIVRTAVGLYDENKDYVSL